MSPSSGIRVTGCECLDGNQRRVVIDDNLFLVVVADGVGIILVAGSSGRRVGNRVATLADVDGAFQGDRRVCSIVERADGPDSGGSVVATLRDVSIVNGRGEPGRQLIGERDVGRLRGTVVGDLNLEGDGVTFVGSRIAGCERLDGNQRSVVIDSNLFV